MKNITKQQAIEAMKKLENEKLKIMTENKKTGIYFFDRLEEIEVELNKFRKIWHKNKSWTYVN